MRFVLALSVFLAACGSGGPLGKCTPTGNNGGPFCVPDGGAPAGQKLTLEIVDQCSGGCGAKLNIACTVTRDAGTLFLSLGGEICRPLSPAMVCPAICTRTKFPCDVPALPEGDYTVVVPNEASQTLRVRDGGAGNCAATPF